MFNPISITVPIPKVFVEEFLKRLPEPLPTTCTVYSFIDEINGTSTEINLNLTNAINFTFKYSSVDFVDVTADIFDSVASKIYKQFLYGIGYVDRQRVKALYDITDIQY